MHTTRMILSGCAVFVMGFLPSAGSKSIRADAGSEVAPAARLTTTEQRADYYQGTVSAVAADTLTVVKDPRIADTMTFGNPATMTDAQRVRVHFWTTQWDKARTRVFRFNPTVVRPDCGDPALAQLALGLIHLGRGHALADLRAGDVVSLDLVPVDGFWDCYRISIIRRPGGTIPPAADTGLPEHCRLHNRCNAEQFVEEKLAPTLNAVGLWSLR